jgi:putative tricarboxylic transport membrane protein
MLQALLDGLLATVAWPAFGYLLFGMAIGFTVGVLPGLGGAVTLALMLPFTFTMEPTQAFAFLLGMLSVTATTGDMTSILFGVPGESTSAALVVDGYQMTKRGEAGRALGAALTASLLGAVIGAFALVAAIPVVRPLVLSFGSPEFFALIVLGLTFVATLGRGAMFLSLAAAAFGLLLSTVGLDPQSGIPRYTFGSLNLWDGLGLVPVAIGLFGLPEVVDLATRRQSISGSGPSSITGVREGILDVLRHRWLLLRASVIGVFVGILPGLGSSVAQWVAYGHAAQTSRDRSRFGKGAIEGVIAPAAVNNSKEGGGLVPTVAFGIPGSLTMAILLGAFLIQGIQPGAEMLTTNLDLTMSFVWMIVLSNLIAVPLALLLIKPIARVTTVRSSLVVPPVVMLLLIGSYAEGGAMFNIGVMLVFGMIGLIMVRLNWPRPPLILGLVLGPLAENYFFLSISRYGWSWLTRPLVLLIFAVALASVLAPPLAARWRSRRGHRQPPIELTGHEREGDVEREEPRL